MAAGKMKTKDPAAEPRPRPESPPQVSCEACMKQIPSENSYRSETEDYVLWFCGLDCYTTWKDEAPVDESQKDVEEASQQAEEKPAEASPKASP